MWWLGCVLVRGALVLLVVRGGGAAARQARDHGGLLHRSPAFLAPRALLVVTVLLHHYNLRQADAAIMRRKLVARYYLVPQ